MAEEIAKPLCAAQKVTMISSGGGEVGAAKLTGEVLDIMTRLLATVEKLTGINISQVSVRVYAWAWCRQVRPAHNNIVFIIHCMSG